MRINLRHGATAAILAAALSVLGSSAARAAAIPGTPLVKAVAVSSVTEPAALNHNIGIMQRDRVTAPVQADQVLLPASNRCTQWDAFKYDSCRHDHNQCTFKPDYVYHDRYGRYNEEGYYHCIRLPVATPYSQP